MDNDVVTFSGGEMDYFVIKIEIALFRAAAPAAFLIADSYSPVREAVRFIEFGNSLMDHRSSSLFVLEEVSTAAAFFDDQIFLFKSCLFF